MSRKDQATVFAINGFLSGQPGEYRIIILAQTRDDAIEKLGFSGHIAANLIATSRDTEDWVQYEDAGIGDIFVTPRGRHVYIPVDPDEIEL